MTINCSKAIAECLARKRRWQRSDFRGWAHPSWLETEDGKNAAEAGKARIVNLAERPDLWGAFLDGQADFDAGYVVEIGS